MLNVSKTRTIKAKIVSIVFVATIVCVLAFTVFIKCVNAYNNDSEEKLVRVAYVVSENFQEGGEGERKYGYGYEYLQNIAYYSGWKYEYVYGSFQDLFNMLSNGEVDLMANIIYTPERAKLINFSTEEQGKENFFLCVSKNDNKINSNDISTLDGAKIGVNAGGYVVGIADEWLKKNNLDCTLIEYDNLEERSQDLENGNIDAVIASEINVMHDWIPLMAIGQEPYYYGVAKERTDLLVDLNRSMRIIQSLDPFYNDNLRAKYITGSAVIKNELTDSETAWLKKHPKVRIGYTKNYMPYCGVNPDTGELDGMLYDFLEHISEVYGMEYEAVPYSTYGEMMDAMHDGEIDALFPSYGEYSLAEESNVMVSDALTHSSMVVLNGSTYLKGVEKVAITDVSPFQRRYAEIYYPDAQQIECASIADCIKAVTNGTADFTIIENAEVNEFEYLYRQKKVQAVDLHELVNVSFAIRNGESELLSILNKGIVSTDKSVITNSLIHNSKKYSVYTVKDFLMDYAVVIIVILICVFGTIIGILAFYYVSMAKRKKEISEAYNQIKSVRYEASHDALTGLLNRAKFLELCNIFKKSDVPLALLMMDVDKFKFVNDNYGHETGDKALMKIATVLSATFRPEDYVVRYAGDEFVVIMVGAIYEHKNEIAAMVESINNTLQNPTDDIPKLSVSVGIAFSVNGYDDELFGKADKALYKTKENGRCGHSFY